MRKLVYTFYHPNFSFRQVIERYPEAAGDITDGLSRNKNGVTLWGLG